MEGIKRSQTEMEALPRLPKMNDSSLKVDVRRSNANFFHKKRSSIEESKRNEHNERKKEGTVRP